MLPAKYPCSTRVLPTPTQPKKPYQSPLSSDMRVIPCCWLYKKMPRCPPRHRSAFTNHEPITASDDGRCPSSSSCLQLPALHRHGHTRRGTGRRRRRARPGPRARRRRGRGEPRGLPGGVRDEADQLHHGDREVLLRVRGRRRRRRRRGAECRSGEARGGGRHAWDVSSSARAAGDVSPYVTRTLVTVTEHQEYTCIYIVRVYRNIQQWNSMYPTYYFQVYELMYYNYSTRRTCGYYGSVMLHHCSTHPHPPFWYRWPSGRAGGGRASTGHHAGRAVLVPGLRPKARPVGRGAMPRARCAAVPSTRTWERGSRGRWW